MPTVWGRRSSFNLQRVMWLVGELSLVHRHIEVGGRFGGLDTPEFRAMNPHGRVPVIDDGGLVVWESHTILRFLAARYGRGSFWSDDAGARSQVERWMDWSQTTPQPDFLMGVCWDFYRTPEAAAQLACDPRQGRALCAAFPIARPHVCGPPVPRRRRAQPGRHPGWHVPLSLLRARHRAAVRPQRGGLVPAPAGPRGLPRARHGAVRGARRPPRSLAHDPEKCAAAFGKDHARTRSWSGMTMQRKVIPFQRTRSISCTSRFPRIPMLVRQERHLACTRSLRPKYWRSLAGGRD